MYILSLAHSNSYAMRGIPIRYKPPIFVPELLQLPADWTKPTLPSSYSFNVSLGMVRELCTGGGGGEVLLCVNFFTLHHYYYINTLSLATISSTTSSCLM